MIKETGPVINFFKNEDTLGCELSFISVVDGVFPTFINMGSHSLGGNIRTDHSACSTFLNLFSLYSFTSS